MRVGNHRHHRSYPNQYHYQCNGQIYHRLLASKDNSAVSLVVDEGVCLHSSWNRRNVFGAPHLDLISKALAFVASPKSRHRFELCGFSRDAPLPWSFRDSHRRGSPRRHLRTHRAGQKVAGELHGVGVPVHANLYLKAALAGSENNHGFSLKLSLEIQ